MITCTVCAVSTGWWGRGCPARDATQYVFQRNQDISHYQWTTNGEMSAMQKKDFYLVSVVCNLVQWNWKQPYERAHYQSRTVSGLPNFPSIEDFGLSSGMCGVKCIKLIGFFVNNIICYFTFFLFLPRTRMKWCHFKPMKNNGSTRKCVVFENPKKFTILIRFINHKP